MQSVGSRKRSARGLAALGALAIVVLALAACGGSGSGGTNGNSGGGTPVKGGTAYFAEGTQAAPNFIFPMMGFAYFSVTNISQLQQLLFRPLYWFGKGSTPDVNYSLSLADPPQYSNGNKTVKITLKPYQWSNGEKLTPQDVVFWINMLKVEKLTWAGYVPGTFPDNVKSISTSGNTVTLQLTAPANPNWYTYNELSQITPMPMAWDVTSSGQKAGSESCATASFTSITTSGGKNNTPVSSAAKSCANVYNYLTAQSKKLSTYASNPLWQVVDGPWKLQHFDNTGNVTMVPNTKYSGPVKPKLAKFVELPFTSDSAEFNALVAGKVDVGGLPPTDITSNATLKGTCGITPGSNNPRLASNYHIVAGTAWQINYFPLNFNSTADNGQAGKIFKQLYFRQAFQTLVNQPLAIDHIFKGYGVPTYGPVPVCPPNSFATKTEETNPYAYNLAKAKSLLTSNGWSVKPGGTTTCSNAAKCGVPAGTPLSFTLQYVSGSPTEDQLMQAEKSSWAAAGIKVNLTTSTFDTVIGTAVPCSGSSCTWTMENWGGGWIFAPDFYPSGEDLFQTGASSNGGSYSDPKADSLIKATTQGNAPLTNYENYLTTQLPVIWQPTGVTATEINNKLQGVTPLNPLAAINPENWYFTK